MPKQQKITFGEMRASGASRIIVHCGDYKCGHSVTIYPALWPDNVRLSDLEERFVCTVCGHRGADVGPLLAMTVGITPSKTSARANTIKSSSSNRCP